MRILRLIGLLLFGAILFTCPAWFAVGHEIAAVIAADELMPTARSYVVQILNVPADLDKAMAAASIRPDTEFRDEDSSTAHSHYIDFCFQDKETDIQARCPHRNCVTAKKWNCVTANIGEYARRLRRDTGPGRWEAGASSSDKGGGGTLRTHGDCTTPDDATIQAAIDATSNNGNAGDNPVSLPGTSNSCDLLSKPLVLPHGGINFYGAGREQTFIGANYYGPVLLAGTDTLKLASALLSGGGNAIDLTGSPFLELTMLLRNHLNGHTAFSIEGELNVPASPSGSNILVSAYDWPYQGYARFGSTDVGAFAVSYQSANPHLLWSATVSTTGKVDINTANNSMTAGNHAIGLYYDGAHLWTCVDGTPTSPVAATGTWVQNKWESISLPDNRLNGELTWPDGGSGNSSFNGKLDNLRISNIARATSGTCSAVPTAKFTYDSNTDLLLKGLSCVDGPQYCLESGTGQYAIYAQSQYAPDPSAGNAVWFPVLGRNGTFAPHIYVHDITLGWNYSTQGAYILNAPWSQFERLAGIGEHNGFNLYYGDFESTVRETRFLGANHNGYQAYQWGYVSNTNNVENATAEQAFVCFNLESAQTGFEEKSGHCLVDGETAIGWLINYATGTLIDPFLDQEGPAKMLAAIYYRADVGEGALTLINGNLDTYGGVPFIVHDAGGRGPIHAIDTNFNNFAEDQPASTVIQFPGFLDYRSLAGIVWQRQAAAAAAPNIAHVPGTCTGSGADTNCARFTYPGASQFDVDGPCTLSGVSWRCQHDITAATTAQWLGNPIFTGNQGSFNPANGVLNNYILFSGQVYLLKGENTGSIFAIGRLELSIPDVGVDVMGSPNNAGSIRFVANAPSAGLYSFQLSFGVQGCCGTAAGLITTMGNIPSQPDRLDSVTVADSGVPLSNEIGNPHVIASGGREATPTQLPCTTAGFVRWSEPVSGGPNKQIVLNFEGCENTTATAQTISLGQYGFRSSRPAAYGACPSDSFAPGATAISLPKSMSFPFTGGCFVAGE